MSQRILVCIQKLSWSGSYWFSIKLNESYRLDYLVSPASSSLVYFGPFLMGSFLIPFSLHTLLHVRAFQGSGPVILTFCLISSTHGFTNRLFSGNFQIHFFSLHFSPKLQIHEASGEVPQTHQIQTEFIFLQTQSGNLEVLDSYQVLQCLLLVDTFSQATTRVCKEYNFVLKYILHSSRNCFCQFNINSANQSFPSTTSSLRLQLSFTSYQAPGGTWRVWVLALYPLLLMLHLLTWLVPSGPHHWHVSVPASTGMSIWLLVPDPRRWPSVPIHWLLCQWLLCLLERVRQGNFSAASLCHPGPPGNFQAKLGNWGRAVFCTLILHPLWGLTYLSPKLSSQAVLAGGAVLGAPSWWYLLPSHCLLSLPFLFLDMRREGLFKKNLIWGEKFKSRELPLSLLQQQPNPEGQGRGRYCCCLNCWERRGGKGTINVRK